MKTTSLAVALAASVALPAMATDLEVTHWWTSGGEAAAVAELAKVGFDPVFGARPLKRAVQQRIENPLSKLLLEGKFLPKSVIPVDVDPVNEPGVFKFDRVVS